MTKTKNIFEKIKKINEFGLEFWSARDLSKILGYSEYSKFLPAIERAKMACEGSKQAVSLHFAGVSDMVAIGLGVERNVGDVHLSRYACYLIAQNGDPRKEEVARARTYFSSFYLHDILQKFDGATAEDFGYMGLYGGLRNKDIHKKKRLKQKETILDYMGSEELAANLFRATQAEAKLKREKIFSESEANKTHLDIGKKVRKTIAELGGTMPEKLPTPTNIKEAKKRLGKNKKILNLKS